MAQRHGLVRTAVVDLMPTDERSHSKRMDANLTGRPSSGTPGSPKDDVPLPVTPRGLDDGVGQGERRPARSVRLLVVVLLNDLDVVRVA